MICNICGKKQKYIFSGLILKKYNIKYYLCEYCDFLCTETPFWIAESYSNAIAQLDVGIVKRNITLSKKISSIIYYLYNNKNLFLDIAGGYGLFCRIMRDYGFDFYWEDKYCKNIFAENFKYDPSKKYDVCTMLEVIEHIENPHTFLSDIICKFNSDAFIFTTELYDTGKPPSLDSWWYYCCETGQHISFYTEKTLHILANSINMKYYYIPGIHIFSKKHINMINIKLISNELILNIIYLIMRRNKESLLMEDIDKIKNLYINV